MIEANVYLNMDMERYNLLPDAYYYSWLCIVEVLYAYSAYTARLISIAVCIIMEKMRLARVTSSCLRYFYQYFQ